MPSKTVCPPNSEMLLILLQPILSSVTNAQEKLTRGKQTTSAKGGQEGELHRGMPQGMGRE